MKYTPREEVERVVEDLSWTLAKVRFARSVLAEGRAEPEKREEVLEALEEIADD